MIIEKKTDYGYIAYYKNDQVFADTLNNGKIYEQGLVLNKLAPYIKSSKTILDIGAHAGSHTILYKYLNPSSEIFAFEPQRKMSDLLTHNVEQNNFDNVHIYNCAVGHENRIFTMSNSSIDGENANRQIGYGTEKRYNLGGLQMGKGGEATNIITIDSLDLSNVDFMKIDVEGFEPLVLLGAEKTIKEHMPTIAFEHNHKAISKSTLADLGIQTPPTSESLLRDFGYNISRLDDQGNFLATVN